MKSTLIIAATCACVLDASATLLRGTQQDVETGHRKLQQIGPGTPAAYGYGPAPAGAWNPYAKAETEAMAAKGVNLTEWSVAVPEPSHKDDVNPASLEEQQAIKSSPHGTQH